MAVLVKTGPEGRGEQARVLERQPFPAPRAHEDRPGLLQVRLQRWCRALPRRPGLVREAPGIRRDGLRAAQPHLLGRGLRRGGPRRRPRALGHSPLPLRFRHLPRQHAPRLGRVRPRPHDLGRLGEGLRRPALRAEGVVVPHGPLRGAPTLRGEQRLPGEPDPGGRERLVPRRELHRRPPRLPEHGLAEGPRRRPHGPGVLPATQRVARGEHEHAVPRRERALGGPREAGARDGLPDGRGVHLPVHPSRRREAAAQGADGREPAAHALQPWGRTASGSRRRAPTSGT